MVTDPRQLATIIENLSDDLRGLVNTLGGAVDDGRRSLLQLEEQTETMGRLSDALTEEVRSIVDDLSQCEGSARDVEKECHATEDDARATARRAVDILNQAVAAVDLWTR